MDELKELWNKEQSNEVITPQNIRLSGSTGNVILKMRKALFWEDIFNKVFTVLVFAYLIYLTKYLFSIGFVLLMLPVLWYYKYLISQIDQFSYQTDVKNYLSNIYKLLKTFVIRYRVFGVVVVPVSFIYGYYTGYQTDPDPEKILDLTNIIVALVTMLAFYGLAELYIYIMYGRKLQKLEELLEEMDKE